MLGNRVCWRLDKSLEDTQGRTDAIENVEDIKLSYHTYRLITTKYSTVIPMPLFKQIGPSLFQCQIKDNTLWRST